MKYILNQLDQFFEQQKEQEQKLLFFLPILVFGFISYYFIYPITDKMLRIETQKNTQLSRQISQETLNKQRLINIINHDKKMLKILEKQLSSLEEESQKIKNLVNKISFFKIDVNKWVGFYNNLPKLAKQFNLELVSTKNHRIGGLDELEKRLNSLKRKKDEVNYKILSLKEQIKTINSRKGQKILRKKIDQLENRIYSIISEISNIETTILDKKQFISKEFEIKMNLNGSFKNFIKFVNRLENEKILLHIRDVEIKKGSFIILMDIYGAKL